MNIFIEKLMKPHSPAVYQMDAEADSVDGFQAVDQAALDRYEAEGFLLIRGGLPADVVAAAVTELEAMRGDDDPGCEAVYFEGMMRERLGMAALHLDLPDTPSFEQLAMSDRIDAIADLPRDVRRELVRKFMGFVEKHPPLLAAAEYPPLLEVIERIADVPMRLFQDMAMIKPPGGREKPWHQDHAYFNLPLDTRVVAVWTALSDVTVANGCMHVIPGGHRDGPRPHFMRRDWQFCDDHVAGDRRLALPMEPGDLMLFDGKLPHGTPTNQTDQQRWALQVHYMPRTATEVGEALRLQAFGSEGKGVTC